MPGNKAARSTSLSLQLQDKWVERSCLIRHNGDEANADDDEGVGKGYDPNLFKPSLCFKTGFCVCRNTRGSQGVASLLFQENLVRRLKLLCWSKKKKKSEARLVLEKAGLVLALRMQPLDLDVDCPHGHDLGSSTLTTVYLHVGFVNFQSWQMTVLPLMPLKHVAWGENHIDLGTLNLIQGFLDGWSNDHFQTSVKFFHDNLNFEHQCTVRLYSIDDDWTNILTECENKSGLVRISKYSQEFTVWMGLEAETSLRKTGSSNRQAGPESSQPKSSQGRGRGRGKKSAASNPPRQPLPRVANLFDQIDSEKAGFGDPLDALDNIDVGSRDAAAGATETASDADQGSDHSGDPSDAGNDSEPDELLRLLQLAGEPSDDELDFYENMVDANEVLDDGSKDSRVTSIALAAVVV